MKGTKRCGLALLRPRPRGGLGAADSRRDSDAARTGRDALSVPSVFAVRHGGFGASDVRCKTRRTPAWRRLHQMHQSEGSKASSAFRAHDVAAALLRRASDGRLALAARRAFVDYVRSIALRPDVRCRSIRRPSRHDGYAVEHDLHVGEGLTPLQPARLAGVVGVSDESRPPHELSPRLRRERR